MNEHLPECPQFCDGQPPKCRGGDCTLCDEVECICEPLRACEERVEEEWTEHWDQALSLIKSIDVWIARRKALREAREAVTDWFAQNRGEAVWPDITAAIDALREVDTPQ